MYVSVTTIVYSEYCDGAGKTINISVMSGHKLVRIVRFVTMLSVGLSDTKL